MKKVFKKIELNIPHPQKHHEDAPALLLEKNRLLCLAVFDGLGGAGSVHILDNSNFVPELKTKAHLAAKAAQFILNERFKHSNTINDFMKYLDTFHQNYENYISQYQTSNSKIMLKGSILKSFPTTIAGVIADLDTEEMHIFWLGDSRVYGIYEKQIIPLSKDHSTDLDPFYISSNATLTRYLQGDQCPKLEIKNISHLHKQYQYGDLLGIFVCTDGLYDAFENIFTFYEFILKKIIETYQLTNTLSNAFDHHLRSMKLNDDLSMSLVLFNNVTIAQLESLYQKQNILTSINTQDKSNEMKQKHLQLIQLFMHISTNITSIEYQKALKRDYHFIEKYQKCSIAYKKDNLKALKTCYEYSCQSIEYLKKLHQIPEDLDKLNDDYDQLILGNLIKRNTIQYYEEYKNTYLKHLFDIL